MKYKLKQDDILKIELFGKLQDELLTIYDLSLISFEYSGTAIVNPFMDETNRYKVDPVEYYGESNVMNFFNSILDIEKKLMIDINSIPKTQIIEKLINHYKYENNFEPNRDNEISNEELDWIEISNDDFEL